MVSITGPKGGAEVKSKVLGVKGRGVEMKGRRRHTHSHSLTHTHRHTHEMDRSP
jgi:hypothetical protein